MKVTNVLTQKFAVFAVFGFILGSVQVEACEPVSLGTLKSRDYIVEMYTGRHGGSYTVKNMKGMMLAEHLSEKELLLEFPELKNIVQGQADDASLGPATPKGFDPTK